MVKFHKKKPFFMNAPLISVITAVYNGERYIEETIKSILDQTVSDFEYIIVDDASTDNSINIILNFKDPRIKLIRNKTNKRLVDTRNIGLAMATGTYVALIDHDDVAYKNRFEIQLKAMRADSALVLVGSASQNIDENSRILSPRKLYTESSEHTKVRLLFRNHFVNSTLFFKRSKEIDITYRHEFPLSEDYDFIVRMSEIGKVHVLPDVLVKYRIHSENYSKTMSSQMVYLSQEVKRRQLEKMGIFPTTSEIKLHGDFEHPVLIQDNDTLTSLALWAKSLTIANKENRVYPHDVFASVINEELALVAEYSAKLDFVKWELYLRRPYLTAILQNPLIAIRIFIKLIVNRFFWLLKLPQKTMFAYIRSKLIHMVGNTMCFFKSERNVCILTYHRIMENQDPMLPLEPDIEAFTWQMETLAACFNVLSLPDAILAIRENRVPPRAVCISFDDGYRSCHDIALPILNRLGLPATVFVTSGYLDKSNMWNDRILEAARNLPDGVIDLHEVGLGLREILTVDDKRKIATKINDDCKYLTGENRLKIIEKLEAISGTVPSQQKMLSREMVANLSQRGIEIGGHTITHPILMKLSDKDALYEITENKRDLEKIIGKPITFFAYPNGKVGADFDQRHIQMVKAVGYTAAFTTAIGTITKTSNSFEMPRSHPWDRTPFLFSARLLFWLWKNPKNNTLVDSQVYDD